MFIIENTIFSKLFIPIVYDVVLSVVAMGREVSSDHPSREYFNTDIV